MIGGAGLASHRREARERLGLFANCRKNTCLGVLSDVLRHRKGAERIPAFGTHGAFGIRSRF